MEGCCCYGGQLETEDPTAQAVDSPNVYSCCIVSPAMHNTIQTQSQAPYGLQHKIDYGWAAIRN